MESKLVRRGPWVALALAALALGGVSALVWLRSSAPDSPSAPPASTQPTVPSPTAPPPTAMPPTTAAPDGQRAGRALSLNDAVRELDLIRPARQKAAEDFTVKLADGEDFRLADQRGKVVLLNFWATWCPPCLEEMPAMERLWRQHKASGFRLLAVSVDARPAVVQPFLRDHRLTFAAGLDPKMDLANAYGVRALPSSFIVDRQGNLAALALGPRTWDNDAAHSLVEALLR